MTTIQYNGIIGHSTLCPYFFRYPRTLRLLDFIEEN